LGSATTSSFDEANEWFFMTTLTLEDATGELQVRVVFAQMRIQT